MCFGIKYILWLIVVNQSVAHGVGAFGIVVIASGESVREEKHLEYGKHDEKFDEDNEPQTASDSHVAETFGIETPD